MTTVTIKDAKLLKKQQFSDIFELYLYLLPLVQKKKKTWKMQKYLDFFQNQKLDTSVLSYERKDLYER